MRSVHPAVLSNPPCSESEGEDGDPPGAGGRQMTWTWGALIVLVLGGCLEVEDPAAGEPLALGEDVRLEGSVMEVDATPMFVDGDGEITVRSERYGLVLVRIPARERLCRAAGLEVFHSLARGDSVRVSGRVTRSTEITVCTEETHSLEKVEERETTTTVGDSANE